MKNHVTRRNFLRGVSAGAAGLSLPAKAARLLAFPSSPAEPKPASLDKRSVSGQTSTRNRLMNKLYLSEEGNVVPTLCEEVTNYRRVRKVLDLPSTASAGTLFILARPHASASPPLRLSVNGVEQPPLPAGSTSTAYYWHSTEVNPSGLRRGANTFEFWTEAPAMTAWSLAIEAGHPNPQSFVSDDGGKTWRNRKMAYLNVLSGEYVVRMRLGEGQDPPPPAMVWEDPSNPRLKRLRTIAPSAALAPGTLMDRVRALTSWLSASWEYTNSGRAAQYAPWDAETILEWGKAKSGQDGQRPIVMCVHYAVCLVSFCQALGIHARPAVLTGDISGGDGHFVAEVWFPEFKKWVMVDPNEDAILWKNGVPLSIPEIRAEGSNIAPLIQWGPGAAFQQSFPAMQAWVKGVYLPGVCFRHRGIWPRADFLSHPELTPSCHGSTAYCETGIVWEKADLQSGFGMFPYFGSPEYFDAPPAQG
jgi:hypothetical protein